MSNILGIFVIAGILALVAQVNAETARPVVIKTLKVGATVFSVEVADTMLLRAKGLSGHAPLGVKKGMLFIFPSPSAGGFWMYGMLFPLDFVWIRNGLVMGVTENAPPMKQTGYRLYYPPASQRGEPVPVTQVLELSAGAVKKFGIRIGDRVHY